VGVKEDYPAGMLLAWDVKPKFFPARAHDFLAACPLAMIAIAYLLYQSARQPAAKEFVKAIMLAIAFLFWAANQLWPDLPQRLSATTLLLRSSSLMCFWSLSAGRQLPQTNLISPLPTAQQSSDLQENGLNQPPRPRSPAFNDLFGS